MDPIPNISQALSGAELDGSVVCTLGRKDLAERGLEWADLSALCITSERIEGGVVSIYPINLADAVEDLAEREVSCCGSWLNTATKRSADVICLEITTANEAGLAVILAMTGHAE